jgi:peptide/nickel transport system substrate-binding protein
MFIYYAVPRYADPDAMLYDMFSSRSQPPRGANWGWYKNDRVDAFLESARYERDQSKRMQVYAEAQRLIVDDAPAIFLMTTHEYVFAWARVKGLVYNPMYSRALYFYGVSK